MDKEGLVHLNKVEEVKFKYYIFLYIEKIHNNSPPFIYYKCLGIFNWLLVIFSNILGENCISNKEIINNYIDKFHYVLVEDLTGFF